MKTFKTLLETIHGPTQTESNYSTTWDRHVRLSHHYNMYSPKEIEAISRYKSGVHSSRLANHLHMKHKLQTPANSEYIKPRTDDYDIKRIREDSGKFHDHIKHLDSAMNRHLSQESFHVYTGLKSHPIPHKNIGIIGRHQTGPNFGGSIKIINGIKNQQGIKTLESSPRHIKAILPAFTSTSHNFQIAKSFAEGIDGSRHILKLHIPKHSNYGGYIAHHGAHSEEYEFLLKRNTKLHIHPIPETNDTSGDHYGVHHHIWHGKIVE